MKHSALPTIAALFLLGLSWAGEPRKTPYRDFVLAGRFRCELPADWALQQDNQRDEKDKIYGVQAVVSRAPDLPAILIAVEYYSPENRYFKSADDLIERYRNADKKMSVLGPEMGEVRLSRVGSYPARRFRQTASYPFPANSKNARDVTVLKEYVLIPRKKGFFMLRYSAPKERFAEESPRFDHVLKTFKTPLP